jgi:hypothetical protein
MDSIRIDDEHVQLTIDLDELAAIRSVLQEVDSAIGDDVAFSARVGAPRG